MKITEGKILTSVTCYFPFKLSVSHSRVEENEPKTDWLLTFLDFSSKDMGRRPPLSTYTRKKD